MADEVYMPRRVNPQDNPMDILEKNAQIRAAAQGNKDDVVNRGERYVPPTAMPNANPVQMQGNIPPELSDMLNQRPAEPMEYESTVPQSSSARDAVREMRRSGKSPDRRRDALKANQAINGTLKTSEELKGLIERIKPFAFNYDRLYLPSKGTFYDGENGPKSGLVHIRPMSGKEEEILATPRWAKSGRALNMIIEACMQESFDVNTFLTVDRTYLIIFLRGISYGPDYEVEIKCPECSSRFSYVINLNNDLEVEECPDNFGPEKMEDVLPTTGLRFGYRLSTGYDDDDIQKYRERNAKFFGDRKNDDSLTERIAQLTDFIDSITNKREIKVLLEQLPVSDVNYIRNVVNDPPFGVDTKVQIICPMCYEEYSLDLPMETNFFFPRRVRTND